MPGFEQVDLGLLGRTSDIEIFGEMMHGLKADCDLEADGHTSKVERLGDVEHDLEQHFRAAQADLALAWQTSEIDAFGDIGQGLDMHGFGEPFKILGNTEYGFVLHGIEQGVRGLGMQISETDGLGDTWDRLPGDVLSRGDVGQDSKGQY